MKHTIEYTGNVERFAGQSKGKLLLAESVIAKTIDQRIVDNVGKPIKTNSVRQYIHCVFIGENRIVFDDLLSYGGTRLMNLEKSIGELFTIDQPDSQQEAVEL